MYIKHYWVSYPGLDRFLIEINEVPKTHPNIKGLDVKYWLTDDRGVDYCLSVCDDDAVLPGGNGVTQLSEEDWNILRCPPQPYPSWTLNPETYEWDPPIPKPELEEEQRRSGIYYEWNEETQEWELKTMS